ncbi:MAG TPA: O-antigen ligase family protein [Ktedonobacteraceae bacterium]|nr:O-antigen ligase family protein [Ktedonobacteraceae bacterium]
MRAEKLTMAFRQRLPRLEKNQQASHGRLLVQFRLAVTMGGIVLLLGLVGLLIPLITPIALPTFDVTKMDRILLASTPYLWALGIAVLALATIISVRADELAVMIVVATRIYVDWYLGLAILGQIITVLLLLLFFTTRSTYKAWAEPPMLWLWGLFLAFALLPAFMGLTLSDGLSYYLDVVFGAFIFFWLGTSIGRDVASVRRLFKLLSLLGTLIALHALLEATTGIFLFKDGRHDLFLTTVAGNYALGQSGVFRVDSFFANPDTSGGFFAAMLFLPLGLFFESRSPFEKTLYGVEFALMVLALFFTYSAGGLLTAGATFVIFVAFVGRIHYGLLLPLLGGVVVFVLLLCFPLQFGLLLQHAVAPGEVSLRLAGWQTGLRVIQAFPLTGIGLGYYVYYERANPYRSPAEFIHLFHPHNSYLELAALGGIPLLVIFLAIMLGIARLALHNWALANASTRALLGGGLALAVSLSFNSVANPAWTLPPLACSGWIILGAISSPLLTRDLKTKEQGAKWEKEAQSIMVTGIATAKDLSCLS